MSYFANQQSLKKHPLPKWYNDAKLGVLVLWGIYSIPAFAPTGKTSNALISEEGWRQYFIKTPYAEWYANSIKIPNSPAARYHKEKYGTSFAYEDFTPQFKRYIKSWDPVKWADFFNNIGAKYVTYCAKFHDGFLMWPSKYKCPVKNNWYSERNTVKELADALRSKGLKMGIYYSGVLDWAFTKDPITDLVDLITSGPNTTEYGHYVDNHYQELIDIVRPDILWNDIAYPPKGNREKIIAYYYNTVKVGCINDRWTKYDKYTELLKRKPIRAFVNWIGKRIMSSGKTGLSSNIHFDFVTPEFTTFKTIQKKKFESILSFGTSVAYNSQEEDYEYNSVKQIIYWFCDIISKNGNLLLVASPKADGSFSQIQEKRLNEFGAWVKKNSEAIFGSTPWKISEGKTTDNIDIRYTVKNNNLYIFLLGNPKKSYIVIKKLNLKQNSKIFFLYNSEELRWKNINNGLYIQLPNKLEKSGASVFKVFPIPY